MKKFALFILSFIIFSFDVSYTFASSDGTAPKASHRKRRPGRARVKVISYKPIALTTPFLEVTPENTAMVPIGTLQCATPDSSKQYIMAIPLNKGIVVFKRNHSTGAIALGCLSPMTKVNHFLKTIGDIEAVQEERESALFILSARKDKSCERVLIRATERSFQAYLHTTETLKRPYRPRSVIVRVVKGSPQISIQEFEDYTPFTQLIIANANCDLRGSASLRSIIALPPITAKLAASESEEEEDGEESLTSEEGGSLAGEAGGSESGTAGSVLLSTPPPSPAVFSPKAPHSHPKYAPPACIPPPTGAWFAPPPHRSRQTSVINSPDARGWPAPGHPVPPPSPNPWGIMGGAAGFSSFTSAPPPASAIRLPPINNDDPRATAVLDLLDDSGEEEEEEEG